LYQHPKTASLLQRFHQWLKGLHDANTEDINMVFLMLSIEK
jgi:hypothetical protein